MKTFGRPAGGLPVRLLRDRGGAVAIIMALVMPVIVGAAAVVVDVGYWRYRARALQTAADTAAIAAMLEKNAGRSRDRILEAARQDAARNGWDPSRGSLTLNGPPASGAYAGNPAAIEILLASNERRLFSGLYAGGEKLLTARAVSRSTGGPTKGSGCVLALNQSEGDAIQLMNNAVIANASCEVLSNSTSPRSIHLNNNAQIAGKATTAGNFLIENGAAIGERVAGAPRHPAPYAGVSIPSTGAGACKDPMSGGVPQPVNWNGGTVNLTPGRWCKGWHGSNGLTLNLAPGVYYIEQGFDISNNVTVNGTDGVTLVLGPGVTTNWGNNALINLVAPRTGPTAGLVLTQYTDDTSRQDYNIANNAVVTFTGAIYLPTKALKVQNNGQIGSFGGDAGCGHVVADKVWLYNNTSLGNECAGVGVDPFGTEGAPWAPGGAGGATIAE